MRFDNLQTKLFIKINYIQWTNIRCLLLIQRQINRLQWHGAVHDQFNQSIKTKSAICRKRIRCAKCSQFLRWATVLLYQRCCKL